MYEMFACVVTAERGAEAEPEANHDPEVPADVLRTRHQGRGQAAAGGKCLQRSPLLPSLLISHTSDFSQTNHLAFTSTGKSQ